MKYQVLVGSLVCFLVSGSVFGTDAGVKSQLCKLNRLVTKIAKNPDSYEDPLSTLEDAFGDRNGLCVVLKSALCAQKKSKSIENIFSRFFSIDKALLAEAWTASVESISTASDGLLNYYLATIKDDGDEGGEFERRAARYCQGLLAARADRATRVRAGFEGDDLEVGDVDPDASSGDEGSECELPGDYDDED